MSAISGVIAVGRAVIVVLRHVGHDGVLPSVVNILIPFENRLLARSVSDDAPNGGRQRSIDALN